MQTCRNAVKCGIAAALGARARLVACVVTAAVLLIAASFTARADEDLPGRVGRIAEFAGQLYLSPEDRATEWQPIGLNYPIASGDNLWVGGDGRAEVDYGGGQFRLAGDTNVHVSRLDENRVALFIAQGRVIVRVRVLDAGDSARIDAPTSQIQLTRPGLYRIDVVPDRQSTYVTVREGEAVVMLANGAQQALPGQTAIVAGPDPQYADVRNGVGQDDFDAWSASRDRRYEQTARDGVRVAADGRLRGSRSIRHVAIDAGIRTGLVSDGGRRRLGAVSRRLLDERRRLGLDVGRCGAMGLRALPLRSLGVGARAMGLVPRRRSSRVRVGRRRWSAGSAGPGWGVSATFGSPVYGWVPLGWGEPFHPWWNRCSNNCWANYNRPYAVNVAVRPSNPPSHFRNADYPGALTAVSGATIAGRMPVASNRVAVPTHLTATAPVLAAAPAVASAPLAHSRSTVPSAPRERRRPHRRSIRCRARGGSRRSR